MSTKSIKIDESYHKRAQALSDRMDSSIKEFIEACIGYFYRTGFDPRDLSNSGHSKMLNTVNQRVEFLVGFNKKQEQDHILPLKQMVEELSQKLESLPQQNGHSRQIPVERTEINELLKELYPDGIYCPSCLNLQNFRFSDPYLVCQHPGCTYQLQVVWKNFMLTELDVLNLLTGGITREIEQQMDRGVPKSVRLYLEPRKGYAIDSIVG